MLQMGNSSLSQFTVLHLSMFPSLKMLRKLGYSWSSLFNDPDLYKKIYGNQAYYFTMKSELKGGNFIHLSNGSAIFVEFRRTVWKIERKHLFSKHLLNHRIESFYIAQQS